MASRRNERTARTPRSRSAGPAPSDHRQRRRDQLSRPVAVRADMAALSPDGRGPQHVRSQPGRHVRPRPFRLGDGVWSDAFGRGSGRADGRPAGAHRSRRETCVRGDPRPTGAAVHRPVASACRPRSAPGPPPRWRSRCPRRKSGRTSASCRAGATCLGPAAGDDADSRRRVRANVDAGGGSLRRLHGPGSPGHAAARRRLDPGQPCGAVRVPTGGLRFQSPAGVSPCWK